MNRRSKSPQTGTDQPDREHPTAPVDTSQPRRPALPALNDELPADDAARLPLDDGNPGEYFLRNMRLFEEAREERARNSRKKEQKDKEQGALRAPPPDDVQQDFFVPNLVDISLKDSIDLMDVAVFRIAKGQTRRGDIITHKLSDVTVEVTAGPHGMATIWDYDIILMMVSHLAVQTQQYRRRGANEKPPRVFRPSASEILKFMRSASGGRQYKRIEEALDRLQGTQVKISQKGAGKDAKRRRTGYFPLIAGAEVLSRTDTGAVDQVSITIPDWIYDSVVSHEKPEILTLDPDYFLITSGLGRFIYRLARKAAGRTEAYYLFKTLHERSGSTTPFRKFAYELRELITRGPLIDYEIAEEPGKDGPLLRMWYKGFR